VELCDVEENKESEEAQLFQSPVTVWTLLPNWLETSSRLGYF
jgi:hypothetical protein